MDNIIISRKPKKSSPLILCKKHPKHHQSPGVCSICLREKLTKLPSRSTTVTNASTSSSSSSLSPLSSECSSNASSYSSPMHRRGRRGLEGGRRPGKGNFLSFLKMSIRNDNKIVLTKSRSMAFVQEREEESMDDNNSNNGIIIKNKKKGFWSKLIRSKSIDKRRNIISDHQEGGRLMHSRTMREMLTTRI